MTRTNDCVIQYFIGVLELSRQNTRGFRFSSCSKIKLPVRMRVAMGIDYSFMNTDLRLQQEMENWGFWKTYNWKRSMRNLKISCPNNKSLNLLVKTKNC